MDVAVTNAYREHDVVVRTMQPGDREQQVISVEIFACWGTPVVLTWYMYGLGAVQLAKVELDRRLDNIKSTLAEVPACTQY